MSTIIYRLIEIIFRGEEFDNHNFYKGSEPRSTERDGGREPQ